MISLLIEGRHGYLINEACWNSNKDVKNWFFSISPIYNHVTRSFISFIRKTMRVILWSAFLIRYVDNILLETMPKCIPIPESSVWLSSNKVVKMVRSWFTFARFQSYTGFVIEWDEHLEFANLHIYFIYRNEQGEGNFVLDSAAPPFEVEPKGRCKSMLIHSNWEFYKIEMFACIKLLSAALNFISPNSKEKIEHAFIWDCYKILLTEY